MSKISKRIVATYLNAGKSGASTNTQGRAYEELIAYIFGSLPGVNIARRNKKNVFNTQELDVVLWNDKSGKGLYFLPHFIPIECKDWKKPVGSIQVSWFIEKLRSRGLSFGILIAANGITGDESDMLQAHSMIAGALREQRQIIVINDSEIQLLNNTNQLVELIKEKVCNLVVRGAVLQ